MNKALRVPVLLAVIVAACVSCASAAAETVTVGSPLTATFESLVMCSPLCTDANTKLAESGSRVASPFAGRIVRWRVDDAQGAFKLRVLRPDGAGHYVAVATSAEGTAVGTGIETFSTDIPIQAGDLIGVDNETTAAHIGFASSGVTGSQYTAFFGALAEGMNSSTSTHVYADENEEVAFNADVESIPIVGQPAPSPTSTPTPTPSPAPAPVVTPTCKVPKLTGKKLKAAKASLTAADCKLGTVTKKEGATATDGKIKDQSPKVGTVLAAGSKVKVTLKP